MIALSADPEPFVLQFPVHRAQASRQSLTLYRLWQRFIDHCQVTRNLAFKTLQAYEGDLLDFLRYAGDLPVAGLQRELIHGYVRGQFERKLAITTIRRRVASLRVFCNWLEQEQLVAVSPFHRVRLNLRKPRLLPRSLSATEMRRLLDAANAAARRGHRANNHDDVLMHFVLVAMFTTGVRLGEMLGLRLADVDAQAGVFQVHGKGSRERLVYMAGPEALIVLGAYIQRRRALATSAQQVAVASSGRPLSHDAFRNRLRRLAEQAGVRRRVTPHMLRHTAATQLLEAGVDIRLVQRLLGHSSIAITEIYTHVSDRHLRDALARANTLRRIGQTQLIEQLEVPLACAARA